MLPVYLSNILEMFRHTAWLQYIYSQLGAIKQLGFDRAINSFNAQIYIKTKSTLIYDVLNGKYRVNQRKMF